MATALGALGLGFIARAICDGWLFAREPERMQVAWRVMHEENMAIAYPSYAASWTAFLVVAAGVGLLGALTWCRPRITPRPAKLAWWHVVLMVVGGLIVIYLVIHLAAGQGGPKVKVHEMPQT